MRLPAVLLAVIAAGVLAIGGCQPDRKAEHASEEGLVDFGGEYTEPSHSEIDQGVTQPGVQTTPD